MSYRAPAMASSRPPTDQAAPYNSPTIPRESVTAATPLPWWADWISGNTQGKVLQSVLAAKVVAT